MVVFVALTKGDDENDPDRTAKGMIEVRWKFTPAGAITYTVLFRKSPDEEAIMVKEGSVSTVKDTPPEQRAEQTAQAMADVIIQATVGTARLRPTPPPDDF